MDSTFGGGRVLLLVIEDNPADVDLLRRALAIAECDCQLSIIEDGAEALALFKSGANPAVPDLAIIDLNLPKHGGLEIIEQMRANPAFTGVPVIILSSSSSLSDRSRLEKYHIERYIVKPADLEEFMKIGTQIRELLSARRAQSDPSGV